MAWGKLGRVLFGVLSFHSLLSSFVDVLVSFCHVQNTVNCSVAVKSRCTMHHKHRTDRFQNCSITEYSKSWQLPPGISP